MIKAEKDNIILKFNVLKGISIYFVVCIHFFYKFFTPNNKPLSIEIYNYFTGFAVPFFLILGGYFLGKKYLYGDREITFIELKKAIYHIFKNE